MKITSLIQRHYIKLASLPLWIRVLPCVVYLNICVRGKYLFRLFEKFIWIFAFVDYLCYSWQFVWVRKFVCIVFSLLSHKESITYFLCLDKNKMKKTTTLNLRTAYITESTFKDVYLSHFLINWKLVNNIKKTQWKKYSF